MKNHSDQSAPKKPKNPLWVRILWFLWCTIDLKETHPKFTHFITYLKNKEIPESKIFFQNKLIKPLSGESANICEGKATKFPKRNKEWQISRLRRSYVRILQTILGGNWDDVLQSIVIVPSIKANYQYVNSKGLESQLILVMDNINAPVIASHLNQRGKKRMNLIIL